MARTILIVVVVVLALTVVVSLIQPREEPKIPPGEPVLVVPDSVKSTVPETPAAPAPKTPPTLQWRQVETITVKGEIIGKDDPADLVFSLMPKPISDATVLRKTDGTMEVVHHYRVKNELIDITFRYLFGQYRVKSIRVRSIR